MRKTALSVVGMALVATSCGVAIEDIEAIPEKVDYLVEGQLTQNDLDLLADDIAIQTAERTWETLMGNLPDPLDVDKVAAALVAALLPDIDPIVTAVLNCAEDEVFAVIDQADTRADQVNVGPYSRACVALDDLP